MQNYIVHVWSISYGAQEYLWRWGVIPSRDSSLLAVLNRRLVGKTVLLNSS